MSSSSNRAAGLDGLAARVFRALVERLGAESVPEDVRDKLRDFFEAVAETKRFNWLVLTRYADTSDACRRERLALLLYGDVFPHDRRGNPQLSRAEPSIGKAFAPLVHSFGYEHPIDLYYVDKTRPDQVDQTDERVIFSEAI